MVLFLYISDEELRKNSVWFDSCNKEQAVAFFDKSQIQKFVAELDLEAQIDFYQKLGGLRIGNRDTSGTNFKHWENDIYEVKYYYRYRLFLLIDGEKCVFLYTSKKQKNKTESKDAEIIRSRAKKAKTLLSKTDFQY